MAATLGADEWSLPEPDGWHKCPECGCSVGYTELYGGGWSIMMDDYQIPFNNCPNCGRPIEDYGSRWFELFGTPERAARTLANVCQFTHDGELCDRCQCYLFGDCDRKLRLMSEQSIYDALLEWLESEVRDD